MVQVSSRSCIGKIKYCHTHDLLRDLAIHKAKEDNFLTVLSKNDTKLNSSTCARRLALHGNGNKLEEHACTNLRSLINFGDVTNFNRFGMLRVLHIRKKSDLVLLHGTKCLKSLKYLAIEYEVFYSHHYKLPTRRFLKRSPLTYVKNLQMVRTSFCRGLGELPPSFWGNKQLRHINFTCCRICNAPEGPPSATDLQSLLTLKGVTARQEWVAELPNFPYIRKLRIFIPDNVAGEQLIKLLSNLNHLGSLHLRMSCEKSITFPDCISAFSNHNRLYSFCLDSWLLEYKVIWPRKEVGGCVLFPPHLVRLILGWIEFEEDPMPQLEKLPNLRVLELWLTSMRAADGKQMICSRGGFGHLQRLELEVSYLKEWKIEEGAMPMLNQLKLRVWSLEIVPDLQYLVNLQELTVDAHQIKSRLEGEDQWKIKHILSVTIRI